MYVGAEECILPASVRRRETPRRKRKYRELRLIVFDFHLDNKSYGPRQIIGLELGGLNFYFILSPPLFLFMDIPPSTIIN